MDTSHTPGPWTVVSEFICGRNGNVAQIESQGTGYRDGVSLEDEVEANARLIAAAPDLLLHLKELLAVADRCIDRNKWAQLDRARNTIAKAEGSK